MFRIYSSKNWKFLFHRISGVILFIYFLLHVLSISTALLFGQEVFNSVMGAFKSNTFQIIETIVVLCVLGHGLNGLHIIASERGWFKNGKEG
jgi:succinate dehydrogenase / fumarate reductase cytochrome b subunit